VKYPNESPTYLPLSILSCDDIHKSNKFKPGALHILSWLFRTDGSKEEIIDALCNETILNEIINFEAKTFSEDQNGINLATEEVKSF
jgi:hypothetical protein